MRLYISVYAALLALLAGFAAAAGLIVFRDAGPSNAVEAVADRHAWDVASWEMRHLPQKWLYKVGEFVRGGRSGDDDGVLSRYFALTEEIRGLEANGPPGELDRLTRERGRLENRVEDILEGRVTGLLEDEGLAMRPPIFTDLGLVFPPVDFEFDSPPRVLATSPRARIELEGSYLLGPGLAPSTVADIEREAEAADVPGYTGGVSALVVRAGGVATYPSVVSDEAPYEWLVTTVIHEWVHQYLVFFPLGRSYFSGNETRTLNESAANLAAGALADKYFQRYGRLTGAAQPAPGPAPQQDTFDFNKEMRALRLEVEELLSAGRTGEGERLMESRREEFAQHGVFIRRLNQAYFAFHGSYADTPASIDPIGPKMQTLLQRAGSPGNFLRLVAAISDERGLDALLREDGA